MNGFLLDGQPMVQNLTLAKLLLSWEGYTQRIETPDDQWFASLCSHLDALVQRRIDLVMHWIDMNTARFTENTSAMESLRRESNAVVAALRAGIQLCGMKCLQCHLLCLSPRHHEGSHDCLTSHRCTKLCDFVEEHPINDPCGFPYVCSCNIML
jgi:hypothetical protein